MGFSSACVSFLAQRTHEAFGRLGEPMFQVEVLHPGRSGCKRYCAKRAGCEDTNVRLEVGKDMLPVRLSALIITSFKIWRGNSKSRPKVWFAHFQNDFQLALGNLHSRPHMSHVKGFPCIASVGTGGILMDPPFVS